MLWSNIINAKVQSIRHTYLFPHLEWIAARDKLTDTAHWPTKENRQNFVIFLHFSGLWKKWPQMTPNRAGRIFFLLIQTLPTFWAERIWILRIFIFFIFWTPNFWISRSQISGSPGPQNLDFPTSKKIGFPGPKFLEF